MFPKPDQNVDISHSEVIGVPPVFTKKTGLPEISQVLEKLKYF